MTAKKWNYSLDPSGIDACVKQIQETAAEHLKGVPKSGTIAFSMEMILLNFQKRFGEDRTVELRIADRFGRVSLDLRLKGEEYDPRLTSQADRDAEEDEFISIIMNRYSEDAVEYRYAGGFNTVHCSMKKKAAMGSGTKMILGLLLGIALGVLGQAFPVSIQESVTQLLDTVNGIILDLIVMGATLVVFTMVVTSIAGFGSVSVVRKNGSGLIRHYLFTYLMSALLFIGYILIVFGFTPDNGSSSSGGLLTVFTDTLANIFPGSALVPFVDCDFLQIIFLAVMMGIAMLVIGDKTKPVREFFESFEAIADQVLDWFCTLLPLFIFTMIPALIWDGQLKELTSVLLHLLGVIGLMLIIFAIRIAVMCRGLKISPAAAVKIIRPAILRGLVTGSSTAALAQIQSATRQFKVKDSFNNFSTAIGLILEVGGQYLGHLILTFYLITVSGTPASAATVISLLIICILLSLAAPPVSGGLIAIELIIARMFNVPELYLAVVPPFMLILDFISTGFRCGGIAIATATAAAKMGELEKEEGAPEERSVKPQ